MKPNIGISEKNLEGVIKILSTLLADEYVLYTKARNYHWNVVGMQFNELHKFFQSLYEELNEYVDDVAERIRTLGGNAVATLKEFLELTRLKEHPGEYPIKLSRTGRKSCGSSTSMKSVALNSFLSGISSLYVSTSNFISLSSTILSALIIS